MRYPLDSYVPVDEPLDGDDLPLEPLGDDRFRWLQWLQLALTAALLVMFFYQLGQLQDANRRIARLYQRLDALDRSRMLDNSPAMAAQQTQIIKRLQELESFMNSKELEWLGSPSQANDAPAALQAPPPP